MFYLYILLFLPSLFSPSLLFTYTTISPLLTNCTLSQNDTCFLIYIDSMWHGFWKHRKCPFAISHIFLLLLLLVLHPPTPDKLSFLLSPCSLCIACSRDDNRILEKCQISAFHSLKVVSSIRKTVTGCWGIPKRGRPWAQIVKTFMGSKSRNAGTTDT